MRFTSRGVEALINYWISDDGYGPFLDRLKTEISGQAQADNTPPASNDLQADNGPRADLGALAVNATSSNRGRPITNEAGAR